MGRVLVLSVLGLGAIFGFTSGVRHLSHHEYGWEAPWDRAERMRSSRMDAMAEACLRAARGASVAPATATPPPAP